VQEKSELGINHQPQNQALTRIFRETPQYFEKESHKNVWLQAKYFDQWYPCRLKIIIE
jgi:hypothetical protein